MNAAYTVWNYGREHPYRAGFAIVNVGAIVLGGPVGVVGYVLNAVGFGPLGPVANSAAAGIQATYGGAVSAGSLFSYLQWAGMVI